MTTRWEALAGSVTGKVLFMGALVLVLLVPMQMIEGLIRERGAIYDTARADIARAWGGQQTIGGPILVVPFRHTRLAYAQPVTVTDELYLLPQALEVTGELDPEVRKRGIYGVPVYASRLHVTARFAPPGLGQDYDQLEIRWTDAQLVLPIADARAVREPIVVTSGNGGTTFAPGGTRIAGFGPALVAPYAALGLGALDTPRVFSFDLALQGTEALRFLPLGDETRVHLTSSWASPSFTGAYLPASHEVTTQGFVADWRVLDLGRGFPSSWLKSTAAVPPDVTATAFGAQLMIPIGVHETTLRAAKYAALIFVLTFAAYFLFELFAGLRLHALQYLLIGLANCVFFLLLLALAEHIGFTPAYMASATAATALVTSYSAAVLQSLRRALPVGALLSALYGYLYVTLRAEDFALLLGAAGSFAVLAAFMYLTRQVDWHRASFAPPRTRSPTATS